MSVASRSGSHCSSSFTSRSISLSDRMNRLHLEFVRRARTPTLAERLREWGSPAQTDHDGCQFSEFFALVEKSEENRRIRFCPSGLPPGWRLELLGSTAAGRKSGTNVPNVRPGGSSDRDRRS